jgi:hypothetical protein
MTVAFRTKACAALGIPHPLDPYRQHQPNLYALRLQARYAIGYVSQAGDHLVLRPRNPLLPVELARIDRAKSYSDYIVGRVCHVAIEV